MSGPARGTHHSRQIPRGRNGVVPDTTPVSEVHHVARIPRPDHRSLSPGARHPAGRAGRGGAGSPSFINDETVTPDGSTYVTDSIRPFLYRVGPKRATDGVAPLEAFLDFTGTPLQYTAGFNVNGIAASADGRHLVLAKSNTADLWRVDVATKEVTKIDLGGASVAGDGLVLDGTTLYAVERQGEVGQIVTIELAPDLASGTVLSRTADPSFDDPTTAALVRGRLLVVNSQFGERGGVGTLDPFTVSSIPAA